MNACSYTQVKEFGTVSEQPKACAACRNVPVFWRELQNSERKDRRAAANADNASRIPHQRRSDMALEPEGADNASHRHRRYRANPAPIPKVPTDRRMAIAATAQTRSRPCKCRQRQAPTAGPAKDACLFGVLGNVPVVGVLHVFAVVYQNGCQHAHDDGEVERQQTPDKGGKGDKRGAGING